MVRPFRSIASALLLACVATLTVAVDSQADVSRYFEVEISSNGQLNSSLYAMFNPCGGCDQLTAHDLSWFWKAFALVVYVDRGPRLAPGIHVIGVEPRVAALFQEQTLYSKSNGCQRRFSTSGNNNPSRFLAGRMSLSYSGRFLNVDAGRPFDRHFTICGRGTASTHGQRDALAAWDGLEGPWHYNRVRAPSRAQLLHGRTFVVVGYRKFIQETHGTPRHMSEGGSSLIMVFTNIPGGRDNVFRAEARFERVHRASSRGFREF